MSERKETIEALKENLRTPRRLISESRESVVVYKDELEAILTYVEDLEEKVVDLPDLESELSVADEVETLIDYRNTPKGSKGAVEVILTVGDDGGEYPYRVRFEGEKYAIGYNRYELGKVRS